MFWPQIIRGVAIMFCLLPPTRIALGTLPEAEVANTSGLFNLMRNLGGAIGIALIDTILYGRSPDLRRRISAAPVAAGDISAARRSGSIRRCSPTGRRVRPNDATIALVRPIVEKASLALSVNNTWAMLACVAIVGLLLVPFARNRL